MDSDMGSLGMGSEVEVTGCAPYKKTFSLLERHFGAARVTAAYSLRRANESAGQASALDCGYYVRRLMAGMNNANKIAMTGEDNLFPAKGPSIGKESDDCGDSA